MKSQRIHRISDPSMDVEELSLKAAEAEGLLKAVANKHRLMVLCKLYQGESSVAALQEAVGLSQSSLSQQISPDCVLTTLLKRVGNRKPSTIRFPTKERLK